MATPARRLSSRRQRRTFITLDLSKLDFQEYYNGFANRVLWPILHYRVDLAEFTSVELAGYLRVNALFADALSPFIAARRRDLGPRLSPAVARQGAARVGAR